MKLHKLRPPTGARRARRRVARGHGSGRVKTAGRGSNGQASRSGFRRRWAFEGGQTPYTRRLPKRRGFRNPTRVDYEVLNVGLLDEHFAAETDVTLELLTERGLIRQRAAHRRLMKADISLKRRICSGSRIIAGMSSVLSASTRTVI